MSERNTGWIYTGIQHTIELIGMDKTGTDQDTPAMIDIDSKNGPILIHLSNNAGSFTLKSEVVENYKNNINSFDRWGGVLSINLGIANMNEIRYIKKQWYEPQNREEEHITTFWFMNNKPSQWSRDEDKRSGWPEDYRRFIQNSIEQSIMKILDHRPKVEKSLLECINYLRPLENTYFLKDVTKVFS